MGENDALRAPATDETLFFQKQSSLEKPAGLHKELPNDLKDAYDTVAFLSAGHGLWSASDGLQASNTTLVTESHHCISLHLELEVGRHAPTAAGTYK